MSFPKLSIVPPSVGLGLFLFVFVFVFVFFIWFWASLHWFFFFLLKIFGSFGFFFMPPSFVRALLIIEKFLLCPPVLFGHFQSLRFFLCSHTCLPVWGVILVKVISKKHYQAQKGTAKDIFQPCERIIKYGLSLSQMHAFRIGKPCFHASMQNDFSLFIQIKLNFGVTSWCFFGFF